MPRILLLACGLFFAFTGFAQIYHYETGKVVTGKPGQILWTRGIFEGYPADYGTFITTENAWDSKSKEVLLPIIRVNAKEQDSLAEPIFLFHGGPGEKNIQNILFFPDLLANHNIYLVGYRGVEGSIQLKAPDYKKALFTDTLSFTNYQIIFLDAYKQTLKKFDAEKRYKESYTIDAVVKDVETVCRVEKIDSLSMISFSFGTMIAQKYLQNYPNSIVRNVQIGTKVLGDFNIDKDIFDQQLVEFCRKYDSINHKEENYSYPLVISALRGVLNDRFKEINSIRFSVYFYSQFYTMELSMKAIDALVNLQMGETTKLIKSYESFYQFYPNIVLGDLLLKKQDYRPANLNQIPISAIDSVIRVVNYWYAPQIEEKKPLNNSVTFSINSAGYEQYFIYGDIDVATPKHNTHIEIEVIPGMDTLKNIWILPNSGHLDLFFSKKSRVEKIINSIFLTPEK